MYRMPLIKGKSPRDILEEKGQLEETLQKHPPNPYAKFVQTGIEPMTNDYDVSQSYNHAKNGQDYIHLLV